uniref:Uncharacterized protein n=1 Tax=Zea mays TaxID=4577 RepID=A0A804PSU4_MAIZE
PFEPPTSPRLVPHLLRLLARAAARRLPLVSAPRAVDLDLIWISLCGHIGSTPKTVSEKEWWQATDTKFQAWPRTAGPPVVMNPISRQNFIVKSTE